MIGTVCLIGPGHVASNPRLVKEADALHAAGLRVRVVSGTSHPLVETLDRDLLAMRPWSAVRVPIGSRLARAPSALRRRLSTLLARGGWMRGPATVAWSESALAGRLARAASVEPADLYIGHYLPGLYAAWNAARRHRSAYGFDAEDSHVDELCDSPEFIGQRGARQALEARLLPGCAHLTAASPLIAAAYERRYGRLPIVVRNVSPLSDAPLAPASTPYLEGRGRPTLYWFSQTIGPGRGLEAMVAAMERMVTPAELHLRGIPAAGYQDALEALAAKCGLAGRIVWHPPTAPGEMVRLAAGHDLGLALELIEPPNRAICLTNKAFTYLLAGVPVVLSGTPAQEGLAEELGVAGALVDLADPAATAARVDFLLGNRAQLAARRDAARRLGREQFNWDREQGEFLRSVREVLSRRTECEHSALPNRKRAGQLAGFRRVDGPT